MCLDVYIAYRASAWRRPHVRGVPKKIGRGYERNLDVGQFQPMPERPSRRRPQSGPSDRFVTVEVPPESSQERFRASVEELVAGELVGVGDGLAASPELTSAARPARLGTSPARRAVCRTLGAGPTRTRQSAGARRMPRPAPASRQLCGIAALHGAVAVSRCLRRPVTLSSVVTVQPATEPGHSKSMRS